MKVRSRFAPSPTGKLHIGGVRTALYAYALAHRHGGQFLLRIEDTDQKRFVEGSSDFIYDMLKVYGIEPDESDKHGGDKGPYTQSKRLDIYKKYAEELVDLGHAYYCFATKEEIDKQRESAQANGERFKFVSPFRDMDKDEARARAASGEKFAIRQRIPHDQKVEFHDPVQGDITFDTNEVDEPVLLKSDGYPTYHLAVVVDDHLMDITHVMRGVEWLPSTPKHILLYKAFGWEAPVITHLAIILDPKGGKLSKRDGSVSADEFLAEGYLPEAMLNFLMLLGWSSPEERVHGEKEREFYSLEDFVELFAIENLNKSNPVFNREKLLWFNHKYISMLQPDMLVLKFTKWMSEFSQDEELKKLVIDNNADYLEKILVLVKDRVQLLSEIPDMIRSFYIESKDIDFASFKQTSKLSAEIIKTIIEKFIEELNKYSSISDWRHEKWEGFVRGLADELKIKAGEAFMVLRIATLGSPFSPPLFESMEVIGKEKVIARMKSTI